jgi:hypothetical protein
MLAQPREMAPSVTSVGTIFLDTPIDPNVVQPLVVEGGSALARTGTGGGAIAGVPTVGNTPSVGIAGAELTPRLAISQDPIGIPVLGLPPIVVGVVDVGVEGVEAIPLEPAPHIPDTPTLPVARFVDIPEIGSNPGSAVVADDVDIPVVPPDVGVVPDAADPIANPPPSYVSTDPINPDGEVTRVEHVVPLPGKATVPVE